MERHPELSLCKGDAFALSRAAAITDNSMRQYYSLLKATLEECSILDCPSQIYNMNESGPSLQRLCTQSDKENSLSHIRKQETNNYSYLC